MPVKRPLASRADGSPCPASPRTQRSEARLRLRRGPGSGSGGRSPGGTGSAVIVTVRCSVSPRGSITIEVVVAIRTRRNGCRDAGRAASAPAASGRSNEIPRPGLIMAVLAGPRVRGDEPANSAPRAPCSSPPAVASPTGWDQSVQPPNDARESTPEGDAALQSGPAGAAARPEARLPGRPRRRT